MAIIACTQEDICPDECINCGGWLHEIQQGGFPGPAGHYCTEDCAADHQSWIATLGRVHHIQIRDLTCVCEICTAFGHPTAAEKAEYLDYMAGKR